MQSSPGFLAAALAVALPLLADQVVLTNGDRVTGRIVKKDAAALLIKSDLMGDVNVKWDKVTSVSTDGEVTVVPADGEPVKGKLVTSGAQVEVAGQQLPLDKVQAIRDAGEQARYERYLHPPITSLWAGFIDVGLAGAQGNARAATFNSAFNGTRATAHDSLNLHFNQIFSRGVVNGRLSDTSNAVRGGWTYNRNIAGRAFINVFNDYESDAFQNLDIRVVGGGGVGWKVRKRERGQFDVVVGGSLDRDRFSVPLNQTLPAEFSRLSGEVYWGDDFSWKLVARSSLKQSFRMFHNVTTTGEYRINFDLGTETRLARWLSWQVTTSDRYLTNPAPGRKTNDTQVSSGIRLTFARK